MYHWSPAERFKDIDREGLVAGSRSTVASAELPVVCVSPDPVLAWQLSGAMEWACDVEQWDLWLVRLAETDAVQVRAEFGPQIQEVKIRNHVPRDRLWYVGRRDAALGVV